MGWTDLTAVASQVYLNRLLFQDWRVDVKQFKQTQIDFY